MLKSIDGGATWGSTGLTTGLVFAPAVAPGIDCNTVYATTWGQGVLKSADGGASWNPANNGLGSDLYLNYITAMPVVGTLFVGSNNGVYRSLNGGANWSQVGLAGKAVLYLALDPNDPLRLFAGTYGDGIYRSPDAGQSWTQPAAPPPGDGIIWGLAAVPFSVGPTVIAASNDQGVLISTDGGDTWAPSWPGGLLPKVYTVLALQIDGQPALFAGTDGQGVYRSLNGGDHWAGDSHGLTNQSSQFLSASNTTLYLGSGNGAWRRPR